MTVCFYVLYLYYACMFIAVPVNCRFRARCLQMKMFHNCRDLYASLASHAVM